MLTIDPRAAERIQPELLSGEIIHWAAMPNPISRRPDPPSARGSPL